jgi:hypothetical protein
MRRRNRIIVVVLVALLGLAVFVFTAPKAAAPVAVSLVSVTELQDTRRVTVEFLRHDAAPRFAEEHQLQVCVAGKWQPPMSLPKLEDGYLLARTNRQRLVFDCPRQSEACRFSLGYRVGPRPYCQAYFFLSRHGVSQRFPVISKAILRCVPQRPRLRHFECELGIPAGIHNQAPQPTPVLRAFACPEPSARRGCVSWWADGS